MTYRLVGCLCLGCLFFGVVGCEADSERDASSVDADDDIASKRSGQGGSTSTPNIASESNGAAANNSGAAYASASGGAMTTGTTFGTTVARGGAATVAPSSGGAATVTSGGATNDAVVGDAGMAGATAPLDQCALLDATKPQTLYLSSDDSNSMASPAIARSIISRGGVPPAAIIRTYEFLNYYDLGYERAAAGQLAVSLEMAKSDAAGTYTLQLGVSSEAATFVRRPMNITFVLDTSGSMGGEPMLRSQAAVKALAASLKLGDIVSAVTWSDTNTIVMDSHVVTGPSDATVVAMANAMQANGSTNLNAGLTTGYSLAQKNFAPNYLNRVVLISDGQANTGVTDEDIIAKGAGLNDGDGIYLVGVGVGDGVNDTLMDAVTDKGRGAYVYLDSTAEAARMFVKRFDETMDVAARAVQVRLDLPWYLGVARFYGEQISTNAKLVEPQHLAPNDAMVFDQVLRPCAAARFQAEDPVTVTTNWVTPTTHEPRSGSASTTLGALLAGTATHLPKGMAIVAYAEALKAGSTSAAIDTARTKVAAALALGADAELQEIDLLLQKLEVLVR